MGESTIRYISYPRTERAPEFASMVADVFRRHENEIGTTHLSKGLTSDQVLSTLREDLTQLGFEVEAGKKRGQKIERPVFFGEDGLPALKYEVDAYHPGWRCGLEIEAGRAWMGNAVYRDLVQALVMVQVDTLFLAIPNAYKYTSGGGSTVSQDYLNPNPPKDTDGRREGSGRGWVRELQGRWPGVLG